MENVLLWQKIVGWAGAVSIICAYLTLTLEWVQPQDVTYNGMNLLGGCLLGYRVYLDRNWANVTLEMFFIAVAIFALLA